MVDQTSLILRLPSVKKYASIKFTESLTQLFKLTFKIPLFNIIHALVQ